PRTDHSSRGGYGSRVAGPARSRRGHRSRDLDGLVAPWADTQRGGIRHDRRNLSDSGFLGQHYEASPEPRWGPTAEPRAEHHRAHQDAHRSCHPRVHRAAPKRRQDAQGDPTLPQALHQPPDLPSARSGPPRPGRRRNGLTQHRSIPGLMPLLFESERIDGMPKKIDPQLRARCVRLVREHAQEYPTVTAAASAVARRSGGRVARVRAALAGPGRCRRRNPLWRDQRGVGRDQTVEGRGQAAAGGQRDPASGLDVLRGGARPPKPLICAFIDEMRSEGYAVESTLRVLRQQGLEIAARTYRAWRRPARIADRTVTD